MKPVLPRILTRLGLTGKLLLLVGTILAISLGTILTLIHLRARTTIRDELRKLEVARIQQWAAKHQSAILDEDGWQVSRALAELMKDPYVIFAGYYDPAGALVAHEGEQDAYTRSSTLDLLIGLKGGSMGLDSTVARSVPLPGLVSEPPAMGRPLPVPQRIRRALTRTTRDPANNFGWIAVTLSTGPLDGLAGQVVVPLALVCAILFFPALALTWWVARRESIPLAQLKVRAEEIAGGDLSGTYDSIPRPADEVGALATGFSIMAGKLKRSHDRMDADARTLALAVAQDRQGIRKVVHDLKNPASSIVAFSEILSQDPPADEAERNRFLNLIRSEADRLVGLLDDFSASGEAMLAPGSARKTEADSERKVILASNDAGIRAILRNDLEKDGIGVVEATNLEDCVREAREGDPVAVLVDLLMKDGVGFALMEELRRAVTTAGIPLVPMGVVRKGDRFVTSPIHFQRKPISKDAFLASAREALGSDGSGARVLIVDDDKFVAAGILEIMNRAGFRGTTAPGGEEGLREAVKNPPDLLVVDLSMPGMDGSEVISQIRGNAQTFDIPILVTTGHDIPNGRAVPWPENAVNSRGLAAGLRVALKEATTRKPQ